MKVKVSQRKVHIYANKIFDIIMIAVLLLYALAMHYHLGFSIFVIFEFKRTTCCQFHPKLLLYPNVPRRLLKPGEKDDQYMGSKLIVRNVTVNFSLDFCYMTEGTLFHKSTNKGHMFYSSNIRLPTFES